jgi:hypothetical protein
LWEALSALADIEGASALRCSVSARAPQENAQYQSEVSALQTCALSYGARALTPAESSPFNVSQGTSTFMTNARIYDLFAVFAVLAVPFFSYWLNKNQILASVISFYKIA